MIIIGLKSVNSSVPILIGMYRQSLFNSNKMFSIQFFVVYPKLAEGLYSDKSLERAMVNHAK